MLCAARSRVQFPAGARHFSLLQNVQTSWGTHIASYPMGTGVLFWVVNWLGCDVDHSPQLVLKLQISGPYLYSLKLRGIIIIIIWHYNPLWIFAFSARSLQVLLSLAVSFQFFIFIFYNSSMTSYCHCCLGLPTGLVPLGFQSNSFLVGLAWFILDIWPSHLILCAFVPTAPHQTSNLKTTARNTTDSYTV